MSHKQQSIWTKDLTPHVVNFMTADITPDFSSELWTKDITHHMVGTLAVFGLVLSAGVMTLGVATVGVNVEVAFAQQQNAADQTAAVVMADNQPAPMPPMANGSTTPAHPTMAMASSSGMFCPQLLHTVQRGSSEGTTTGDVGLLQQFIANHFGLSASSTVTGYFGSTTQALLEKFQQEQGIVPAPFAGPLTRAAIAKLCGDNHMGSTSPMMGSTTMPGGFKGDDHHPMGTSTNPVPYHDILRPEPTGSSTNTMASGTPATVHEHHEPPVPPKHPTPTVAPTAPVSYIDNSSNSASVVEAINEIGDGYGRLFTATLSALGL